MNYRHAFHAGNFADVLKHLVLTLCLERLNAKPTPWRYIDTHAGVGLYDLTSQEAERSPEWRQAVLRLWEQIGSAPPDVRQALGPLMACLRAENPGETLTIYPGSPSMAAAMARADDALRLCELHEESNERLHAALGRDRRVKIELRDGYEALVAYLPPPERRGLVLIDPPFEAGRADARSDFAWILRAMRKSLKRWPEGAYAIWRPIKDIAAVEAFDAELATLAIDECGLPPDKLLVVDLWVRALGAGPLAGAGLVLVNPPYGLEENLAVALPWLADVLDQSPNPAQPESGWRLQRAAQAS